MDKEYKPPYLEEQKKQAQIEKDKKQKAVEEKKEAGDKKKKDAGGIYQDSECSVCLFERIEVVLPCTHAFCSGCINDWLTREKECPICR